MKKIIFILLIVIVGYILINGTINTFSNISSGESEAEYMDIIRKTDTFGDIEFILDLHNISHLYGWELIMSMLLDKADSHLEVHGTGAKAYFTIV